MSAPIIDLLRDLMSDVLIIKPWVSGDAYGARTLGAAVSRTCRITAKTRTVRGADGRQVVSTLQATLDGAYGVTVKDEFTLPVRFNPRKQEAVAVQQSSDENGPHHEVVFFS